MEKLLSISVAAYNVEKLISENIESFLKSKYLDRIEVLVVNDGSKDDTKGVVEKYVNEYPDSIKLINKENGGAGSTVNRGIEAATGKYFRIVDGDDFVDSTSLDEFIEFLESKDVDMVVSNFTTFDSKTRNMLEFRKFELPEEFNFSEQFKNVPNEMHALTFKTEIMKKINKLDNGFYTDVEYVLYPIEYVEKCAFFNKNLYMYRLGQAEQSVNPNRMMKNISQHEVVLNSLCEWFNSLKDINSAQKEFIQFRISVMARNNVVTLLFFDTNKDNYNRIKDFIIKQKQYPDLYSAFKKSKLLLVLRYFKLPGYKYLAKKYKRDFNVIK